MPFFKKKDRESVKYGESPKSKDNPRKTQKDEPEEGSFNHELNSLLTPKSQSPKDKKNPKVKKKPMKKDKKKEKPNAEEFPILAEKKIKILSPEYFQILQTAGISKEASEADSEKLFKVLQFHDKLVKGNVPKKEVPIIGEVQLSTEELEFQKKAKDLAARRQPIPKPIQKSPPMKPKKKKPPQDRPLPVPKKKETASSANEEEEEEELKENEDVVKDNQEDETFNEETEEKMEEKQPKMGEDKKEHEDQEQEEPKGEEERTKEQNQPPRDEEDQTSLKEEEEKHEETREDDSQASQVVETDNSSEKSEQTSPPEETNKGPRVNALPCAPRGPIVDINEVVSSGNPEEIFKVLENIGSGASGEVFVALDTTKDEKIAIKKMALARQANKNIVLNEVLTMRDMNHENIVNFLNCYLHDATLWLIMEHVDGASLAEVIEFNERTLSEMQVAYIAKEVTKSLIYLHGRGIIHRDIKSDNILISHESKVKVTDFGYSAQLTEEEGMRRQSIIGTTFWMAPEVIMKGTNYGPKADIWSLGVMVLECIEKEPPYMDLPTLKALYMIVSQGIPKFKKPETMSEELKDFITKCTRMEEDERPTAIELLEHPFLQKVDSDGLPTFVKTAAEEVKVQMANMMSDDEDD